MAFIVKNTFLEVDGCEPGAQQGSGRSNSLPRSWKVMEKPVDNFPSDASTASFETGSNHRGHVSSDNWSDCSIDEVYSPHWPSPVMTALAAPTMPEVVPIIPVMQGCSNPLPPADVWDASTTDDCKSPAKSPKRRTKTRRSTIAEPLVQSQPVEFPVILDKRSGHVHGIDIDWSNGVHLLVEKVNKPGLVSEWNHKHPSQAIVAGSWIMEVNGVRGDAEKILAEMKKNTNLKLKVRVLGAPSHEDRKDTTALSIRTALSSQAPIFRPEKGQPTSPEGAWPMQGPRPELVEAVQGLLLGLTNNVPADWWMEDGLAPMRLTATIPQFIMDPNIMLSAAQQAVLQLVAQYPNVYIMGRNSTPFKPVGPMGFSMILAFLPHDRIPVACWDTYGQGFCMRRSACGCYHPEDSELLEVQITLQSPEPFVCIPVVGQQYA